MRRERPAPATISRSLLPIVALALGTVSDGLVASAPYLGLVKELLVVAALRCGVKAHYLATSGRSLAPTVTLAPTATLALRTVSERSGRVASNARPALVYAATALRRGLAKKKYLAAKKKPSPR